MNDLDTWGKTDYRECADVPVGKQVGKDPQQHGVQQEGRHCLEVDKQGQDTKHDYLSGMALLKHSSY